MKINKNGFWEENNFDRHSVDDILCNSLIEFFKDNYTESIIDIGCGTGYYTKRLKEHFDCDGYDGNPYTEELTNGLCKVLDFTKPTEFAKKYDAVLCLEVVEHIPKELEFNFLDNIFNIFPEVIVLSWAIHGQGGDGHINEQPNDYVISVMEKNGYQYSEKESLKIREVCNLWWFKNTLMVFYKNQ